MTGPVAASEPLPQDAQAVVSILKSMGVEEYEPRVVNQLLEFQHRYVTDVLSDSKVYAEHAGKSHIDVDDVRLSIQSRVTFSFTQPPPREVLMELARARNSIPLPGIDGQGVFALPPESECLLHANYQVQPLQEPDVEPDGPKRKKEEKKRAGSESGVKKVKKEAKDSDDVGKKANPSKQVSFSLKAQ